MYREHVKWWSPSLGRDMEFLWFGKFGRPVILFPTSAGRYFENEDFHLASSVKDKVNAGEIQLVLVDTVNDESWYNKNVHPAVRVARHVQYDKYLRHELVPYIHNRAQRGDLAVYGASFGGYHAANFAARYPDVVSRAILFSGVFDIRSQLDGYWNNDAYFNCPVVYIPNMDSEWVGKLSRVEWIIATGEHDSIVDKTREFSGLLSAKGIPNYVEIWPGVFGHDWPWWREHLRRFV
ncbi:MAG TPA: alpha/beta hydrolase-fold protein [Thermoanaerobaculia bacterium]|nr:alpha/beta hydrolase-fold protein [Thermoanaerobaculia bacterium]